jgi:hypothetical protein
MPVAFELVKKPIQYSCLTTKKLKRKSEKTKNEMMRFTENYSPMHLAAPTPSFRYSARLRNISYGYGNGIRPAQTARAGTR